MRFLRVCVALLCLSAFAVFSLQAQDNPPKSNANASASVPDRSLVRVTQSIPFRWHAGPAQRDHRRCRRHRLATPHGSISGEGKLQVQAKALFVLASPPSSHAERTR